MNADRERDAEMGRRPTVDVVVLTTGDRPDELAAALHSVRSQQYRAEVYLWWNGVAIDPRVEVDHHLHSEANIGIPAGRNRGFEAGGGEVVFFLDDDAVMASDDLTARCADLFADDPGLGVVAFRIVDEWGDTAPRHVPRVGGRHPDRSGWVTSFIGAAFAVRRSAFAAVGGFPDDFFYALEETDLAWAMIDAGYSVWYEADVGVQHPRTSPKRHADFLRLTSRNRVLLVRRRLPMVLAVGYLSVWCAITTIRERARPSAVRAIAAGTSEGIRFGPVVRTPMSWRTVWALTRLGRPPII